LHTPRARKAFDATTSSPSAFSLSSKLAPPTFPSIQTIPETAFIVDDARARIVLASTNVTGSLIGLPDYMIPISCPDAAIAPVDGKSASSIAAHYQTYSGRLATMWLSASRQRWRLGARLCGSTRSTQETTSSILAGTRCWQSGLQFRSRGRMAHGSERSVLSDTAAGGGSSGSCGDAVAVGREKCMTPIFFGTAAYCSAF
jgi:hypothetical protein